MKKLFAILLLSFLPACAQLGIPTAQTFNERLAAGYALNTAVRQSATTLLQSKAITANDGDSVLKTTDAARAGLDVAKSLAKTDMTAADAKLNATRTVLVALQSYLATKGGK